MRLSVILILLAAVSLAQADVIVLKNGKRIVVDTAREKNGRVEYEIGDNTFAISKGLVDRLESGGVPLSTGHDVVPKFAPSETLPVAGDLASKLIHDGRVDTDVLATFSQSSDLEVVAGAYCQAAKFEQDHGNPDRALRYYGLALAQLPNNNRILDHYASLLIQIGRGDQAIPLAERSTRSAPNSADGWMVLGFAYYSGDRNPDAIRAWQKSLELRPDSTVEKYLDKALKDANIQATYQQRDSGHFSLKYEGRKVSPELSSGILQVLEQNYDDLSVEFTTSPKNISVILYTDQAFFDVTQSPSWTGAINDGKIRVPVSGLTTVTPELSRILRHELSHTFINQLCRGRCPQWLHEGVAQLVEPRSAAPYGQTLAKLFADQHEVPMNLLEGSFLDLGSREAAVAYIQSLAVAEYIRDTYGMDDIQRILRRIGEGASTESALRSTVHSGYQQLETEVGQYLESRYGK